MERWSDKPLRFSEVLDLTFYIFRKNFVKLFLIALIILGPAYLLLGIAQSTGEAFYMTEPLDDLSMDSLIDFYSNYTIGNPTLYFVAMLILSLISIPIGYASLIIAVNQIKKDEEINISSVIKSGIKRYFPLLGGSIVLYLILFGLILGTVVVIFLLLALLGGTSQAIILTVLLSLFAFLGLIYLAIRWSFNFVAIVFEKVSPGLSKSWRLTRGNFWRLFGLYIILSIIVGIIIGVLQLPFELLLSGSVISLTTNYLLTIIGTVISLIAYTVVYFDLRVRNEAVDLKDMITDYSEDLTKKTD